MPELPTPPKGRSWLNTCQPQSSTRRPECVLRHQLVQIGAAEAEGVHRQRARPCRDVGDGLVDVVVGDHRQDRPEQLFLGDAHVLGHAGDHVQRNAPARPAVAAGRDLGALGRGLGQQVADALRMRLAGHAGVFVVALHRGVELAERGLHRGGEGLDLATRHQRVVGRDADLAAVEGLAVGDAFGGRGQRPFGRDQRRRLAAQFQGHRRQVLRRRAHDVVAHRWRAGEDDVIERQLRKVLRLRHLAAEDRDLVFGKTFGQHLRQQLGRARRQLRHLDHHAVAGGQRGDQRAHRQVQREVPRADDADHALGLVVDAHAVAQEQQLGGTLARLHPAAQRMQRMVDLEHRAQHFGELGLGRRAAAEIGADCRDDLVLVALQQRAQRRQLGLALGQRGVGMLQERLALAFEHLLHALDDRVHGLALRFARRRHFTSRSSRRRILPTVDLGSASTKRTIFGTL